MKVFLLVAAALIPGGALAEDLAQPKFLPGDSWVYREKAQRGASEKEIEVSVTVVRADGDDLLVSSKPIGSAGAPKQRMYHADWSAFRGVNGAETVVSRPLAFPLTAGKTWKVEYTELNPSPTHAREQYDIPYKVVGWEDVETPAGKFKALKIEAKGTWVADVMQAVRTNSATAAGNGVIAQTAQNVVQGARRFEGRIYHAIWYAPEVKRWVKSLDENYSSTGEMMGTEETLLLAYVEAGASKPSSPAVIATPTPVNPAPAPVPVAPTKP